MSAITEIKWADTAWNPVLGCSKISPGCKHCYAETIAEFFRGVQGHAYEQGFDLRLAPEKLAEPLKWSTPKTILVNSLSDLFHENVPVAYIQQVTQVMQIAARHTYQVLTKRAERMRDLLQTHLAEFANLDHIWWGVSVENRQHGVPRIDALRETPAAVRFLSIEPLLENLGQIDLSNIHWVIIGGEGGRGARPMQESWVLDIMRQCRAANVPFYFKHWGPDQISKVGRLLEGRTYDEMPPSTKQPEPDRS